MADNVSGAKMSVMRMSAGRMRRELSQSFLLR